MPIIKTVTGNLLNMFENSEFDTIVHGCNCFHTMGAGIAGQIARKYPEALDADRKSKLGDVYKLGRYTECEISHLGRARIVNAYTQFKPGREDAHTLYGSIASAFTLLNQNAWVWQRDIVGIPKIGAGIAGGDWNIIEKIIHSVTGRLDVVVVEWDGS